MVPVVADGFYLVVRSTCFTLALPFSAATLILRLILTLTLVLCYAMVWYGMVWYVVQDVTEARVVHRMLCDLVEHQDPGVLGGDLGQVLITTGYVYCASAFFHHCKHESKLCSLKRVTVYCSVHIGNILLQQ